MTDSMMIKIIIQLLLLKPLYNYLNSIQSFEIEFHLHLHHIIKI